MKSRTTLLAILVATVSACAQEEPPTGTTLPPSSSSSGGDDDVVQPPRDTPHTSQGEAFFIDTLYPSLQQTCGFCHIEGRNGAPQWLGADAKTAYDQIRSYKNGYLAGPVDANGLLLKESHAGGQKLSGQQRGLVAQWLDLEYGPSNDDGIPDKSFSQALENFTNCMNFALWQGSNLDQIPATPVAVDGQTVQAADCQTCHLNSDQTARLLLDANDAQATFDNFKVFPSVIKLVTSNGFPFTELIPSNRLVDKGADYNNCVVNQALLDLVAAGDLNNEDYCHPNYAVDKDVEDALEDFVNDTISISESQICGNN